MTTTTPCKFFARGACQRGTACTFSHETPICRTWAVNGTCTFGHECPMAHTHHKGAKGHKRSASRVVTPKTSPKSEKEPGLAPVTGVSTRRGEDVRTLVPPPPPPPVVSPAGPAVTPSSGPMGLVGLAPVTKVSIEDLLCRGESIRTQALLLAVPPPPPPPPPVVPPAGPAFQPDYFETTPEDVVFKPYTPETGFRHARKPLGIGRSASARVLFEDPTRPKALESGLSTTATGPASSSSIAGTASTGNGPASAPGDMSEPGASAAAATATPHLTVDTQSSSSSESTSPSTPTVPEPDVDLDRQQRLEEKERKLDEERQKVELERKRLQEREAKLKAKAKAKRKKKAAKTTSAASGQNGITATANGALCDAGTSPGIGASTPKGRQDNLVYNGPNAKAEHAKKRGVRHIEEKDWPKAYEAFTEAIEHDPDFWLYYANRATAALNLQPKRYSQALSDLQKCLDREPRYARGYYLLSVAFRGVGDYHTAAMVIHKACDMDPRNLTYMAHRKEITTLLQARESSSPKTNPTSSAKFPSPPKTSPTSAPSQPKTSPTSAPSQPKTSPTSVPSASTSSPPKTSPTSVPSASTSSQPKTSPTSAPSTSTSSPSKTSPTSAPSTSTSSQPKTSPTSAPSTSTSSPSKTSPTSAPSTSTSRKPGDSGDDDDDDDLPGLADESDSDDERNGTKKKWKVAGAPGFIPGFLRADPFNQLCGCPAQPKFTAALAVGDAVDCFHTKYRWLPARVVDVKKHHVYIRYTGRAYHGNEWIDRSSPRLQPPTTRTSSPTAMVTPSMPCFTWKIENAHLEGRATMPERIYSSTFRKCGILWRMMAMPRGHAGERDKSFSVYLVLADEWMQNKKAWQYPEADVDFVLVHKTNESKNNLEKGWHKKFTAKDFDHGFADFVSLDYLSEFLHPPSSTLILHVYFVNVTVTLTIPPPLASESPDASSRPLPDAKREAKRKEIEERLRQASAKKHMVKEAAPCLASLSKSFTEDAMVQAFDQLSMQEVKETLGVFQKIAKMDELAATAKIETKTNTKTQKEVPTKVKVQQSEEDNERNEVIHARMVQQRRKEEEERRGKWETACNLKIVGQCDRSDCYRTSRNIAEDQLFYLVECTAECKLKFHKDSCWRAITRKHLPGDLDWGKPCIKADCTGTLVCIHLMETPSKISHVLVARRKSEAVAKTVVEASEKPQVVPDPQPPSKSTSKSAPKSEPQPTSASASMSKPTVESPPPENEEAKREREEREKHEQERIQELLLRTVDAKPIQRDASMDKLVPGPQDAPASRPLKMPKPKPLKGATGKKPQKQSLQAFQQAVAMARAETEPETEPEIDMPPPTPASPVVVITPQPPSKRKNASRPSRPRPRPRPQNASRKLASPSTPPRTIFIPALARSSPPHPPAPTPLALDSTISSFRDVPHVPVDEVMGGVQRVPATSPPGGPLLDDGCRLAARTVHEPIFAPLPGPVPGPIPGFLSGLGSGHVADPSAWLSMPVSQAPVSHADQEEEEEEPEYDAFAQLSALISNWRQMHGTPYLCAGDRSDCPD